MLDILPMRSSEAGADLCKIESWNAEAISSKSNILLSIFSSDRGCLILPYCQNLK